MNKMLEQCLESGLSYIEYVLQCQMYGITPVSEEEYYDE